MAFRANSFKFLWKKENSKPPTMPFRIVACTFPDNLSRNSCIPPSLRTSPRSLRVDIKIEQKRNTENLYSNARFNKQGFIVVYTFTVLLFLAEISYWFFTIAFSPLLELFLHFAWLRELRLERCAWAVSFCSKSSLVPTVLWLSSSSLWSTKWYGGTFKSFFFDLQKTNKQLMLGWK